VERAQRANAGFALDEPTTATVAEICRRLDGMPLALELAAALIGSMTTGDILERMSEDLLVSGRSAVSRHRSIRTAVEWSEALLSDPEQIRIAALSSPLRRRPLPNASGSMCGRFPENLGVGVRETLAQATRGLGRRGLSLRAAGRRMSLDQAVVFAAEDPRMAPPGIRLTQREMEVAQLVRHGRTDPQIAGLLHIAKRTAEGHVENLRNKLGVGSRAEVAAWAAENLPDDEAAEERPSQADARGQPR